MARVTTEPHCRFISMTTTSGERRIMKKSISWGNNPVQEQGYLDKRTSLDPSRFCRKSREKSHWNQNCTHKVVQSQKSSNCYRCHQWFPVVMDFCSWVLRREIVRGNRESRKSAGLWWPFGGKKCKNSDNESCGAQDECTKIVVFQDQTKSPKIMNDERSEWWKILWIFGFLLVWDYCYVPSTRKRNFHIQERRPD